VRGLRQLGLNPGDYKSLLRPLYDQRYKYNKVQTSTFFRRDTLEKDLGMIQRAVASGMRTRDRLHNYDWEDTDSVERSVERTCETMCSFCNLCTVELIGGDAKTLRKRLFRIGDPLDYYHDKPDPETS
jgi:hypothetical protein